MVCSVELSAFFGDALNIYIGNNKILNNQVKCKLIKTISKKNSRKKINVHKVTRELKFVLDTESC